MQDNRHIIGRPESGTHSAVKNSTRVLAKNQSHSAAQERPYKPKRRLIDFDVSDKSIEEDELSRLLIDKLSICNNSNLVINIPLVEMYALFCNFLLGVIHKPRGLIFGYFDSPPLRGHFY